MSAVHKIRREDGDVIQSILMIAVFAIISLMLVNITVGAVSSKTEFADSFRAVATKAETWAVANPPEAAQYTSGNMTYSELVNAVAADELSVVPEAIQNSTVQYLEQGDGQYKVCVPDMDIEDEKSTYVYSTDTDSLELKESCE